ncbi:MAG TPA: DUF72 domain-containing protein [Planctomycetes bacterium]|nr:DUF72 domain-containing protein [Planctomycetota bacterium]
MEFEVFLERLDRYLGALPDRFRYAVEVRNRDWIDEPLLDLLRRHRAAFVWVEKNALPHPADLAERLDIVTADFAYARLIGDRRAVDRLTDTFDHIVLDREASLVRWAEMIQRVPASVSPVFAFANNHYAGHGPATARRLQELAAG